jgi:hypothetical protein
MRLLSPTNGFQKPAPLKYGASRGSVFDLKIISPTQQNNAVRARVSKRHRLRNRKSFIHIPTSGSP